MAIARILKFILDLKLKSIEEELVPQTSGRWVDFRKAWKIFLSYPSDENARNVYILLPDRKSNSQNQNSTKEDEMWEWVWKTLPVLEKEMYAGNRYAVKVAFRLYPFTIKFFTSELDSIFENFIYNFEQSTEFHTINFRGTRLR